MNLTLKRTFTGDRVTLGALYANGEFFCYTLEPDDEGVAHPAIPAGKYRVIVTYSRRFQRLLPEVVDVPGRSGIRFHSGNTAHDTSGCILLGKTQAGEHVGDSRLAVIEFMTQIQPALKHNEPVWLDVQLAEASEAKRA